MLEFQDEGFLIAVAGRSGWGRNCEGAIFKQSCIKSIRAKIATLLSNFVGALLCVQADSWFETDSGSEP